MAGVLPRSFYDRPAPQVARELVGAVVRSTTEHGVVAVRLVEVEAYAGEADPASHAWRGPTPRTRVMYGPPGRSYVYFSYGMHWALNVVCLPPGTASAVLLRAGEVVDGLELARARRRAGTPDVRLASGPANLAAALGLDAGWNDLDVTRPGGALTLRRGSPVADDAVATGPRVGLTRGVETPWRFLLAGDPHVSPPRRANPGAGVVRRTRGWAP
ncbi:MAG: DNA-3-methyladenine glycosylase [Frankiales bacterium]|nr:DNA-3-methyladenine glycosylase [Frankiales bacterium]